MRNRVDRELHAAAEVQRALFPQETKAGEYYETCGDSIPCRAIGGDFFDIIDLGEGRLAVALGDVSGKGVAAGVLMTATQGFLHACLREHGDVKRAAFTGRRG